jgi:hypothetical protein
MDDEPVLDSTPSTQPSDHAPTDAPTSIGRRSSSLTERSRRRIEAEKGPRPWPDDRLYNHRSLFLLTLQNPFRQAIIRMIEWEHWDNKVIGVIMCNTITLAMYDCFDTPQMRMCAPEDLNTPAGPYGYCNKMKTGIAPLPRLRLPSRPQRAPSHLRHDACTGSRPPILLPKLYLYLHFHRGILWTLTTHGPCYRLVFSDKYFPQYLGRDAQDIIGKLFSAYFTIEFVIQVLARGLFWGPKTYLTDTANWLDAFIVALGLFDFVPQDGEGGGGFSSLRSLRILRVLRAVKKYPALKELVVLIAKCMAKLIIVVGLCAFLFLVFGILGVQLYKGALAENACARCERFVESGPCQRDVRIPAHG